MKKHQKPSQNEEHTAQDDPVWPHLRLALAILSTAVVDVIKEDSNDGMRFIEELGPSVAKAQERFNRRVRFNCGDININYIKRSLEKRRQS